MLIFPTMFSGFIFLSGPIVPELNFHGTAVFLRPSPDIKNKNRVLKFLVISEKNQPPTSRIFCNRFNFDFQNLMVNVNIQSFCSAPPPRNAVEKSVTLPNQTIRSNPRRYRDVAIATEKLLLTLPFNFFYQSPPRMGDLKQKGPLVPSRSNSPRSLLHQLPAMNSIPARGVELGTTNSPLPVGR